MATIAPPPGLCGPPGLDNEDSAFGNPLDVLNGQKSLNRPVQVDASAAKAVWKDPPQSGNIRDQGVRSARNKELSEEHEALAMDNARLCWENASLRESMGCPPDGRAGPPGRLQADPWAGVQECDNWWLPTDPWAAWQAAEAGLQPGVTATLHSLKAAAELNGVSGVIEYWHAESGRWVLKLPNGEEKFAKPENLVVNEEAAYGMFYTDMTEFAEPPIPGSLLHFNWQGDQRAKGKKTGLGKGNQSKTSSFGSEVSTSFGCSSLDLGSMSTAASSMDDAEADTRWMQGVDWPVDGELTTLMMRNIPNNYTREMLLDLINKHGFLKSYDLVYLPIDFQTEVGLGYAFINMVSEAEVAAFRKFFHGFSEWEVASQKVCEVHWSHPLQGLQSHIDRYRNSPVMHEAVPDVFRPMLFSAGVRVAFPAPTKRIRAPRLRRPRPKEVRNKSSSIVSNNLSFETITEAGVRLSV